MGDRAGAVIITDLGAGGGIAFCVSVRIAIRVLPLGFGYSGDVVVVVGILGPGFDLTTVAIAGVHSTAIVPYQAASAGAVVGALGDGGDFAVALVAAIHLLAGVPHDAAGSVAYDGFAGQVHIAVGDGAFIVACRRAGPDVITTIVAFGDVFIYIDTDIFNDATVRYLVKQAVVAGKFDGGVFALQYAFKGLGQGALEVSTVYSVDGDAGKTICAGLFQSRIRSGFGKQILKAVGFCDNIVVTITKLNYTKKATQYQ